MKRTSAILLILLLAAFALPLAVLAAASLCEGDLVAFLKGSQADLAFSTAQYTRFFSNETMLHRFGNSLKITGGALLIQLPLALLGGLYLARCSWRSTRAVRFLLLILLLLPFQSVMVPVFKLAKWTQLYDKQLAVILLQGTSPLGMLIVWLLVSTIPVEQWEAAQLDCKSQTRTLCRVVLPQIAPGLAVMLLLCFAEAWNLVEAPSILLPDHYLRPASMVLNGTASQSSAYSYADAVMYSVPIVGMYLLVSRGMSRTVEY